MVRRQGQHLVLAEDLHDKLWKLFRSHRKVNTLLVSPTGDTPAKVQVSARKTEQGAIQGLSWYRCLKLFQLDFLPAMPPTDPASLLQPPNPEPLEGAHHPQMLTSGNKSKKEKRRVRCRRWWAWFFWLGTGKLNDQSCYSKSTHLPGSCGGTPLVLIWHVPVAWAPPLQDIMLAD